MSRTLKVILIVLITFGSYFILDALYFKVLRQWIYELISQFGVSHIITYAISGIPLFIGTFFISRKTPIIDSLGISKSIIKGFLFATLCTLPLFIGFSILFDYNAAFSLDTLLVSVIAAAFFEELFFRGFLFGILYKESKLGFITAVFFGALYFGLIHLYQSTDLGELVGIFLITFLAGILFAWVYVEWNHNLWAAIFLHLLMNLAWELFAVSDTALGGIYSNVLRLLCVALIIIVTIVYKKKKGIPLQITRKTLWAKEV